MPISLLKWKSIGDKSCGRLYSGHLATLPIQIDWTGLGGFLPFSPYKYQSGENGKRGQFAGDFWEDIEEFF